MQLLPFNSSSINIIPNLSEVMNSGKTRVETLTEVKEKNREEREEGKKDGGMKEGGEKRGAEWLSVCVRAQNVGG